MLFNAIGGNNAKQLQRNKCALIGYEKVIFLI